MCSHPECKVRLVLEGADDDMTVAVGEAAHIVARADRGPRGDPSMPGFRRHGYVNLILLCGHHHAMVDRQWRQYSVEDLRGWKAEHEAWVRARTAIVGSDVPWTAIVQEDPRRMDVTEAAGALGAGNCVTAVTELCGPAAEERRAVEDLLATTPAERRRFAVFSTGRVPLAVQLGFVLGDRARVALFHYHREEGTWSWPAEEDSATDGKVTVAVKRRRGGARGEAVIRVSLSGRVPDVGRGEVEVEIAVAKPSVGWLRRAVQLAELARAYAEGLQAVREHGAIRRVHLYYAGPGAGAVCLGRAYNPRMNAEGVVYEYNRGAYSAGVVLG
jgi:hypothetical protein